MIQDVWMEDGVKKRLFARLHRWSQEMTIDRGHDMIQGAFLYFYEVPERLINRTPEGLYAAVVWRLMDERKRFFLERRFHVSSSQVKELMERVISETEPFVCSLEAREKLHHSICCISPKLQVAILLKMEGLTVPTISKRLQIPVDTVKSRLKKAYRELRSLMLQDDN